MAFPENNLVRRLFFFAVKKENISCDMLRLLYVVEMIKDKFLGGFPGFKEHLKNVIM